MNLPSSPIARTLAGLSLGAAGGALFMLVRAPLPWMLGALMVTTTACLCGFRYDVPQVFRTVVVPLLGVFLGSSFTPDIVGHMKGWGGPMAVMAVFIVVAMSACSFYFRRVAKTDPVTAYFASAPGGVMDMVVMAEAFGGNLRIISMTQTIRILIAVCTIPLFFRYVVGVNVPAVPPNGVHLVDIRLAEAAILGACAFGGLFLGRWLRLPAPLLAGPLVLSMIAHSTGFSHSAPPIELVALAQIVLGTALGARFAGVTASELKRIALYGVGSALLLLALAVATAFLAAPFVGVSVTGLVLAFSPGGLAEMGLIALSMGLDTAFVSTMHLFRLALVIVGAPLAFQLLRIGGRKPATVQGNLTPTTNDRGKPQSPVEEPEQRDDEAEARGVHPSAEHAQGEGRR